jgi:hypothetical protein
VIFMLPRPRSLIPVLGALLTGALLAAPLARAEEPIDPPGRVGRVSAAVGTVSLQPAGSDGWVSDVLNRPLTNDDRLWSDRESRAEVHVGSTAIRLGSETGIGILNLDDRTIQLRLSAGTLQLRVRSLAPDETLEVATASGSVAVLRPGSYRVDVGDRGDTLRVAVRQGQVAVTDASGAMTVPEGQLADFRGNSVNDYALRPLPAGDGFDQWASERDRREDRAVSTRYVSRDTMGYEDLDDYGTWRTVDDYGPIWVPQVAVGWSPYRDGHWAWIAPWGWSWIDDAPWGFAPSHYGRWLRYRGQWCWAPGPPSIRPMYAPALVGWVGGHGWSVGVSLGGPPVAWFPLGWNEVYVPSYRYSNAYVQNINVTNIHVSNTYVTNYIAQGRPARRGERDRDQPRRFANMAIPGAVIATSRDAFVGSQRVGDHLARVTPRELERARGEHGVPALAPTRESIGRPTGMEPPRRELWSRPVVARTPPPAPAASFESQRRAIVANGGRPPPIERPAMPRDLPDVAAARPDPVRVIRGGPARDLPTAGRPAPDAATGRGRAAADEPPRTPAPVYGTAPRPDRPPAENRPATPSEWRREAGPPPERRGPNDNRPASAERPAPMERPQPIDRPVPAERPAAPDRPARPAYPDRPVPMERPQSIDRPVPAERPAAPDRPARPAYPERPVPMERPQPIDRPVPAAPDRPARPAYEPRPVPEAPARPVYEPRPAPEPPARPVYEARPDPRPAPREWSPPPAREPPAMREPPAVREYRQPPPPAATPAPRPSAPPAPAPDKPHPADHPQRDPRDR